MQKNRPSVPLLLFSAHTGELVQDTFRTLVLVRSVGGEGALRSTFGPAGSLDLDEQKRSGSNRLLEVGTNKKTNLPSVAAPLLSAQPGKRV